MRSIIQIKLREAPFTEFKISLLFFLTVLIYMKFYNKGLEFRSTVLIPQLATTCEMEEKL